MVLTHTVSDVAAGSRYQTVQDRIAQDRLGRRDCYPNCYPTGLPPRPTSASIGASFAQLAAVVDAAAANAGPSKKNALNARPDCRYHGDADPSETKSSAITSDVPGAQAKVQAVIATTSQPSHDRPWRATPRPGGGGDVVPSPERRYQLGDLIYLVGDMRNPPLPPDIQRGSFPYGAVVGPPAAGRFRGGPSVVNVELP